jgi:hypothetical protein
MLLLGLHITMKMMRSAFMTMRIIFILLRHPRLPAKCYGFTPGEKIAQLKLGRLALPLGGLDDCLMPQLKKAPIT